MKDNKLIVFRHKLYLINLKSLEHIMLLREHLATQKE